MKGIVISLLFAFFITSCDPQISYEYFVNNESDSTVIVLFRDHPSDTANSIVHISPRTERIFFETTVWGSKPHDEGDEFLHIMDTLAIMKKDSSLVKKKFLKRENWTYDNDIRHFGLIKVGTNRYRLKLAAKDI